MFWIPVPQLPRSGPKNGLRKWAVSGEPVTEIQNNHDQPWQAGHYAGRPVRHGADL